MQVSPISSNQVNNSFGNNMSYEKAVLREFAEADDKTIRNIAWKEASNSVNDKKHNRISNAIYWAIPVTAGLAAAVRSPKDLTRFMKAKVFTKNFASWATAFFAIDAAFAGKKALDKHSKTSRNFSQNHPFVASVLSVGTAIGAMLLGSKGVEKVISKFGPKFSKQLSEIGVEKFLNGSKVLNKASEYLAKVPSSIKNFTKGALDFSPLILAVTSFAHSLNHEKVKNGEANKNYFQLKNAQNQVQAAMAINDEMESLIG